MPSAAATGVKRALVVIDMTVEQASGLSRASRASACANIAKLCKSDVFCATFDSRLWISDPTKTSLSWVYPNVGHAGTPGAELVPELQHLGLQFVSKFNYSCFVDTELENLLRKNGVSEVFFPRKKVDFEKYEPLTPLLFSSGVLDRHQYRLLCHCYASR